MRKLKYVLVFVLVLVLGLIYVVPAIAGESSAIEEKVTPVLTVWPPIVKLSGETQVTILGSGFEPGQELAFVIPAPDGGATNVNRGLFPVTKYDEEPIVDQRGNFAFVLDFGYIRLERVVAEGIWELTVTDSNYNPIAVAPIGIADPDGVCRIATYPRGKPDYEKNPNDPRPLDWLEPLFEYPERPVE